MTAGPPPPQHVPGDPDAARANLAAVEELLEATIARAGAFSDAERNQRVNDEWSLIESLRHIVFVIDIWLSKTIKGEDDPFHPTGLPPHFLAGHFPPSIDPDAAPTFDEATAVLRGRLQTLGTYVEALTPDELARPIGTHAETVAGGLGVIFDELTYHDGFVNRDLSELEERR